jgi:hypothetical protein
MDLEEQKSEDQLLLDGRYALKELLHCILLVFLGLAIS